MKKISILFLTTILFSFNSCNNEKEVEEIKENQYQKNINILNDDEKEIFPSTTVVDNAVIIVSQNSEKIYFLRYSDPVDSSVKKLPYKGINDNDIDCLYLIQPKKDENMFINIYNGSNFTNETTGFSLPKGGSRFLVEFKDYKYSNSDISTKNTISSYKITSTK